MVRHRPTPLMIAQQELDTWYSEHLDKHTRFNNGRFIFLNEHSESLYNTQYEDKIETLRNKHRLTDYQLVKSTFDTHTIELFPLPEPEPVGMEIGYIQPDTPSEETKEPEPAQEAPILRHEYNPRIGELQQQIIDLNMTLQSCRTELNRLLFSE